MNSSVPILDRLVAIAKDVVPLPIQVFVAEELHHPIPRNIEALVELWNEKPLPLVLETLFFILVLYVLVFHRSKKKGALLPADLVDELVDSFKPEPLAPPLSDHSKAILSNKPPIIEEQATTHVKIQGKSERALNLTSFDFLSIGAKPSFKKAAMDALEKYGCGSCGPRGFYGSIDTHVYCEQAITKFLGVEDTIIYSDSNSAVSSAIPAFSNKDDLLVVDEGCNDAILTGVKLSRSTHHFFKHNDMDDLERVLKKIDAEDKAKGRKPQRRFIVTEAIFRNYGDISHLDRIVELKKKYIWRLFVDESNSFGVLGKTGRGITEHFGLPVESVEILVASMASSIASVGGFCSGKHDMVEHQRLNGAGYVFSASQPPFTATAAEEAIHIIENEGETLISNLRRATSFFVEELESNMQNETLTVLSDKLSPIIHLALAPKYQDSNDRMEDDVKLRSIAMLLQDAGVLVSAANYLQPSAPSKGFVHPPLPRPTLRLSVQADHSEADLAKAAKSIANVSQQVLGSWNSPTKQPARDSSNSNTGSQPTHSYGLRKR